jgi:hypothetical protein
MSVPDKMVEAMQEQDVEMVKYYFSQTNTTEQTELFLHPEFLPTLMDILTQFDPEEDDDILCVTMCQVILFSCHNSRSIGHYLQEWIPELLVFSMAFTLHAYRIVGEEDNYSDLFSAIAAFPVKNRKFSQLVINSTIMELCVLFFIEHTYEEITNDTIYFTLNVGIYYINNPKIKPRENLKKLIQKMMKKKIYKKMEQEHMADVLHKNKFMHILLGIIKTINSDKSELICMHLEKKSKVLRDFWKEKVTTNCSGCGIELTEKKIKFCGGCNFVAYCGREHQKGDWKSHKNECKRMQKLGRKLSKMKPILKRIGNFIELDEVFVQN